MHLIVMRGAVFDDRDLMRRWRLDLPLLISKKTSDSAPASLLENEVRSNGRSIGCREVSAPVLREPT
jgi:hypothetical protein